MFCKFFFLFFLKNFSKFIYFIEKLVQSTIKYSYAINIIFY